MPLSDGDIQAAYHAILGRDADAGGSQWAQGLGSIEDLRRGLVTSDEWSQAQHGVSAPPPAGVPQQQWDDSNNSYYFNPMSRGQIENSVNSSLGRNVTDADFQNYSNLSPAQFQQIYGIGQPYTSHAAFKDYDWMPNTIDGKDQNALKGYDPAQALAIEFVRSGMAPPGSSGNAYDPKTHYSLMGGSHEADGTQLIPGAKGWDPSTFNNPIYQKANQDVKDYQAGRGIWGQQPTGAPPAAGGPNAQAPNALDKDGLEKWAYQRMQGGSQAGGVLGGSFGGNSDEDWQKMLSGAPGGLGGLGGANMSGGWSSWGSGWK